MTDPLWLRPYIRRARGDERAEGLRDAIRLAFYQQRGKPFYVLVQRGWPRLVMAVGESREAIIDTMIGAFEKKPKRNSKSGRRWSGKSFRGWAKRIQMRAGGRKSGGRA